MTLDRNLLRAPFPYFGGKLQVADIVWRRFGAVENYIEPFFGSGAILLSRPASRDGAYGYETVNDLDGMIVNFWRAVQAAPDDVARWADWPQFENDLHARDVWLRERRNSLQSRLEGDPDFYDAKIAGWWCWSMSCFLGNAGNPHITGPWTIRMNEQGERELVRCDYLSSDHGISRTSIDLMRHKGIHRSRGNTLTQWMNVLAHRLRSVRVCCSDWTRMCGGRSGDALSLLFAGGSNSCAIFLDPPYSCDANRRDEALYAAESLTVAHDVRRWAIRHGENRRMRICLCGYEGEHDMPASWECVPWTARGGFGNQSANGNANRHRERLWFSPGCIRERTLF